MSLVELVLSYKQLLAILACSAASEPKSCAACTLMSLTALVQSYKQLLAILTCSADGEWSLQDLSTSCWALARLNIGNRKLLDLIYNRIIVDIPVLSAKDISYQLWGFAALGYPLQSNVLNVYLVSILRLSCPVAKAHVT